MKTFPQVKPVAVVTGSSRGVGKLIAQHLVQSGFVVHGCSRRPPGWTDKHYHHAAVDLGNVEEAVTWLRQVESKHGSIDVFVNNAAVTVFALTLLSPFDSISDMVRVNFLTPTVLCREVGQIMAKQKHGKIVNISSVAVALMAEGTAIYTSTKSALEAFTRVFAKEMAPLGVSCNVLSLSYMKTDMADKTSQRAKGDLLRFMTVKREVSADDLCHALDFLISARSALVNGHVLRLGF